MRAFWALFAALLLVPVATASEDKVEPFAKDPPQVLELIEKVAAGISGQSIYDCINEITTSPTAYRLIGSPNRELFLAKYGKVFSSLSPRIKDHIVTYKQGDLPAGVGPATPNSKNIIGVLPGKDLQKWIVIGGHYDTQAPTTGAIDNTSGICVVKEIAKAVVALDLELDATMVFAWWDGEEWGLYGSRSFVRNHNETANLIGADPDHVTIMVGQSFDIVGINYPAYNTWVGYGQQAKVTDEFAMLNLRTSPTDPEKPMLREYSSMLEKRTDKERVLYNNSLYEGLVKEVNHRFLGGPEPLINVHQDNYGRSDHQPFIGAGFPGMRIQGSHDYQQWPHYHLPSDTLATAEIMAGGKDRLIAGFDRAAEAGGLTAFYVALKAGYGDYGNQTLSAGESIAAAAKDAPAKDTPGLLAPIVLGVLALAVVLRRRDA